MNLVKKIFKKINSRINLDQLFNLLSTIINYKKYYNESQIIEEIIENLKNKNKILKKKKEYHIFIAVKNVNWEKAGLVDTWKNIAEITHYDWGNKYDQYLPNWHIDYKVGFNKKLLERVSKAHEKKTIDVFLGCLSGRWVFPETIKRINQLGIITINIGFDDHFHFWNKKELTGWSGNAEISPIYDINLSLQSINDILKFKFVKANGLFLIPGGNKDVFNLQSNFKNKNIISFIGKKYGKRINYIIYLQKKGIKIFAKGKGWNDGEISLNQMLDLYQKSLLTLGFGYINLSNQTGIKGRDFEVPMTGTPYITTYNSELARYFKEGEEIIFYKNKRDLYNKIIFYLENKELLEKIGNNGKVRALKDHCWQHRWIKILKLCQGERINIL